VCSFAPGLLRVVELSEARYPECRVEIAELPFRERYAPLLSGDVDLMVARLPLNDRALVVGPVVSNEPRVVAVARNHLLTRRDTVSLEDLADYPSLTSRLSYRRRWQTSTCPRPPRAGGEYAALVIRLPTSALVVLIARGRVVQPTVASAATRFAHPNVICLPIADMPPSRSALAWRRRASHPPLVAFIKIASDLLPRRPSDPSA
jgi:DNA-binding transcriptional LysR family regulator